MHSLETMFPVSLFQSTPIPKHFPGQMEHYSDFPSLELKDCLPSSGRRYKIGPWWDQPGMLYEPLTGDMNLSSGSRRRMAGMTSSHQTPLCSGGAVIHPSELRATESSSFTPSLLGGRPGLSTSADRQATRQRCSPVHPVSPVSSPWDLPVPMGFLLPVLCHLLHVSSVLAGHELFFSTDWIL